MNTWYGLKEKAMILMDVRCNHNQRNCGQLMRIYHGFINALYKVLKYSGLC